MYTRGRIAHAAPGRWVALVPVVASLSCGAFNHDDRSDVDEERGPSIATLTRDLGPGSKGEDVRVVQRHLATVGYFPNEPLSREYPRWAPMVPQAPEEGVYDDATDAAVRAYQLMHGLAQTGVVDQATRTSMGARRCGVPDGMRPHDPRDKYDLLLSAWPKTQLTWRLIVNANFPGNLDPGQVSAVLATEFAKWSGPFAPPNAISSLTFTQIFTSNPDIDVFFEDFGASAPFAKGNEPASDPNVRVAFNTRVSWTLGLLGQIAVHEIGHTLGLGHSAQNNNVMGAQHTVFVPTLDDKLAMGVLYDPFQNVPGCARDVAVGAGAGANLGIWVIGCSSSGDGLASKWMGPSSGWFDDTKNGTGRNIAVDVAGVPWIVKTPVNQQPNIFARTTNDPRTGGWVGPVGGGCANDIGIGADGSVWVTGCLDGRLHKWNGSGWVPDNVGFASRVSVDADGRPWVVDFQNNIHRKRTNTPGSGTYQLLPGKAIDIAVHRSFVVNPVQGTLPSIWAWIVNPQGVVQNLNEQAGGSTNRPACAASGTPCDRFEWRTKRGGPTFAVRIGMGSFGPWIVQNNGTIFQELNW
jgi:hypothetical protein